MSERALSASEIAAILGTKGGQQRALKLSAARRSEIARKAALARWQRRTQLKSKYSPEK